LSSEVAEEVVGRETPWLQSILKSRSQGVCQPETKVAYDRRPGGKRAPDSGGGPAIEFKHVSFAYREPPVEFNQVTFAYPVAAD
jgi:hypothetical protein